MSQRQNDNQKLSSASKKVSQKFIENPVPSNRLSRFAKLGGLAASLTGNVIKNSFSAAITANKPSMQNTLLNLNNAETITKHLSQMRGAAMKIGQMLSMDAGELLPKEWEPILSLLREQANSMPKTQLLNTLNEHWGKNWADNFEYFSFEPIAAASIGQVHRAKLKTGEELAIKIQYPGVATSIDSDIDNVAGLLKLTRLIPKGLDIQKILDQAKKQLKQEADYSIELRYLEQYRELLKNDNRYVVPAPYKTLSNKHILCMEFVDAQPIDSLLNEPEATRNAVVENLFELVFSELFDFRFTQSDPNFANYMYLGETQQLVLLDFGACRPITESTSLGYKKMATAMQSLNTQNMIEALLMLGLLNKDTPENAVTIVSQACEMASESLQESHYNFKKSGIIKRLQQHTMGLVTDKNAIASPDFDVALVNRKVTGTVMLANKLNVEVRLTKLLSPFI